MTTIASLRRGLATVLLWAAGALLVTMTALVMIQIFSRYALNQPTAWTEELVRYALIWTSFLAASYAFIERRHMALGILRDRLGERPRRLLVRAVDVLVLLFAVLVLGIGGVMLVLSSTGDLSALLGISRGAVYAIVPISGVTIALAQIVTLLDPSGDDPEDDEAAAGAAAAADAGDSPLDLDRGADGGAARTVEAGGGQDATDGPERPTPRADDEGRATDGRPSERTEDER